jgi:hypothetical protein
MVRKVADVLQPRVEVVLLLFSVARGGNRRGREACVEDTVVASFSYSVRI